VSVGRSQSEAPGQDSFLDIVANLVGILIILVMVIGARATDAMVEAAPSRTDENEPKVDLAAAQRAADAVERDIHHIDAKIKRQQVEVAYRRKERDKMLQLVAVIEHGLDQRRQQLDETRRKSLESSRQWMAAREELEDLKASRQTLETEMPLQNVIEHLPTPMAKTVFGKEVHFRLQGGRLTYVPWDELVERLKVEAPEKVWKLKDAPRITETLGPIRGFGMQYTLRRTQQKRSVGGSVAVRQAIELDRFVLVPMRDGMGEPLDRALQNNSEFRGILSLYDPDRTTVTLWVYPDSFNEFRTLKADLFRHGYLAAGRPMPEGHPIGGSPEGSRSAAQ
jgi:hypothetical protein